VLGVRPGASRAEVVGAFRRFALRNHPDRGGDPDHFREGVDAYQCLTEVDAMPTGTLRAPADVVFHRRRPTIGAVVRRARRRFAVRRP